MSDGAAQKLAEAYEAIRAYSRLYDCPGIDIGDGEVSGCVPQPGVRDCPTCAVRELAFGQETARA